MKDSKLILVALVMLFSGTTISAQKKKPSTAVKSGPIEMPKDTEVQVIPDDEKFQNMLHQINAAVEF